MSDVPAGYTLDAPAAPSLPAGYKLDAPTIPEGYKLDASPTVPQGYTLDEPKTPDFSPSPNVPAPTDHLDPNNHPVMRAISEAVPALLKGVGQSVVTAAHGFDELRRHSGLSTFGVPEEPSAPLISSQDAAAANQSLEQGLPTHPTILNRGLGMVGGAIPAIGATVLSEGAAMPVFAAQGLLSGEAHAADAVAQAKASGQYVSPEREALAQGVGGTLGGAVGAGTGVAFEGIGEGIANPVESALAKTALGVPQGLADTAAENATSRIVNPNQSILQGAGPNIAQSVLGNAAFGAHDVIAGAIGGHPKLPEGYSLDNAAKSPELPAGYKLDTPPEQEQSNEQGVRPTKEVGQVDSGANDGATIPPVESRVGPVVQDQGASTGNQSRNVDIAQPPPGYTLDQPPGVKPIYDPRELAAALPKPSPIIQPIPEAKPEYQDTRRTGERFHGTSSPISELQDYSYGPMNIYGQGLYSTDDVTTGLGYTKKGGGKEPTLYRVTEKRPMNMLDLEKPAPSDVASVMDSLSSGPHDSVGGWAQDLFDENRNQPLRKWFDEVRADSRSEGLSADTVQELFDQVGQTLKEKGYDGYEHQGGTMAGRGRRLHNVKIYFDPTDTSIERVDPNSYLKEQESPNEISTVPNGGAEEANAGANGPERAANTGTQKPLGTDGKTDDNLGKSVPIDANGIEGTGNEGGVVSASGVLPGVTGGEAKPEPVTTTSVPHNPVNVEAAPGVLQGKENADTAPRLKGGRAAGAVTLPDPESIVGEKSFIGQDVVPAAKTVAKTIGEAAGDIRRLLMPQGRGDDARVAAGALRESGAELAQRGDRARAAFAQGRAYLESKTKAEKYDFIDRMERGQSQTDMATAPIAKLLRDAIDDRRSQVQALGTGRLQSFIQDYFPHIWKDPEKASEIFKNMGKRPMEGSKSFLKQRTIPTFKEGIAKGLEPVSDNPIDLVQAKLHEMDKYILAHKVLGELKDKGLAQFMKATRALPEGYAKIDDKIATVYGPPADGGLLIRGSYAAPEPVARVINNYLSPGLRAKSAAFRGYLGIANVMNQFQLGLSAFHLGFTSVDSVVSKTALGFEKLASGDIASGFKDIATSPAAPITNLIRGNKVLQEWMKPGTQGNEIGKIVDAMKSAGGRAKQDPFYQTSITKNMMQAFKTGNYTGGALRLPFSAMEQLSRPIMEYIVPRQKMGIFADMAKNELSKLPPDASHDQVRAVMGKAWDSVDNRMGQMVYDNLFWNKAVKDLGMASIRSLGWNLGTWRELGGGVTDLLKSPINAVKGNRVVTHRLAYTMALPMVVGAIGGLTHYLATGKKPDELKDYFFPQTGEKDQNGDPIRVSLPSYMKDVYALAKNPGQTFTNKLHPLISTLADMLQNKDYYGTKIRNEDDPVMKQAANELKFIGKQFIPFAVRGSQQFTGGNTSLAKKALPFVGITPAPHYLSDTPAESLAKQMRDKTPLAPRTQEQVDASAAQRKLADDIRKTPSNQSALLQSAIKDGTIRPGQVSAVLKRSKQTEIQHLSDSLPATDAIKVFNAGNDEEKSQLRDQIKDKILRSNLDPEKQDDLFKQAGITPPQDMLLLREKRTIESKAKLPGELAGDATNVLSIKKMRESRDNSVISDQDYDRWQELRKFGLKRSNLSRRLKAGSITQDEYNSDLNDYAGDVAR